MVTAAALLLLLCLFLSAADRYVLGAPFIFKSRAHKSATRAYLERLQNELEATQSQLYISQKTCISLKKRVDEQRRGNLEQGGAAAITDVIAVESEDDQLKIQQKDEKISELRSQLETETEKVKQHIEQMKLLEAELKEVKQWKDDQANVPSESTFSDMMRNEYDQKIEILSLKLEAAELAAKTNRSEHGDKSASKRAQQLKLELESVRKRYTKLSVQLVSASAEDKDIKQQNQLEQDMDDAIKSIFQAAFESIEDEWEEKYQNLKQQLDEITQYSETLRQEKDAALGRLKESSSHDELLVLREKLENELTTELTEKITEQLTHELTLKIEKQLRKKYKKMKKELQTKSGDASQVLQVELDKMKQQYEAEYATKLKEVQEQNEKQLEMQQEKMRKLVRALVERESKEKRQGSKANKMVGKQDGSNSKTKKKSTVKKNGTDKSEEELVKTSTMSSSAKSRRSQTGVSPIRGSAVK